MIYVPSLLETLDLCTTYPSKSATYQCHQQT